jgi:hypothetical protein
MLILNFHFNAGPGPDPDSNWHQDDANPNADPTPSFTHVGKKRKKLKFYSQLHQFTTVFVSHQRQMCHDF